METNKNPLNNTPEYSVTELSMALKRTVEDTFGYVRLRGEISGFKRAASGHLYLALKDEKAVMDGIMWKGVAGRLTFRPEDGLEVICTGKLTTYPGRSKYQIVIERMEPAGAGALMALLEARKKKLAAEGLFDAARKKAIPYLPNVIGVVTSPTGAVIRDILHRLSDRFPRHVLVWPVLVQGDGAAEQIAGAIRGFNKMDAKMNTCLRPDVLIVARGGGSLEDLWCFNEEVVVRAAANSDIPLISAVGHETDTTLIDYASDLRAPTPTAAAELAVPVRYELIAWAEDQGARLTRSATNAITTRRQRLVDLARALPRRETLFDTPRQRLDLVSDRLPNALRHGTQTRALTLTRSAARLRPALLTQLIKAKRDRLGARVAGLHRRHLDRDITRRQTALDGLARRLDRAGRHCLEGWASQIETTGRVLSTLGYTATLERGYAVVRAQGSLVTRKSQAAKATSLEIQFADGRLDVGGKPARKSAKPAPPDQGNLF